MTEHQRARWTMCAPISAYNYAMQDFTDTVFTRNEQHKKATISRMGRDGTDKTVNQGRETFSPLRRKGLMEHYYKDKH